MATEHSIIQKKCMDYLELRGYFPFYVRESRKCYPGVTDIIAVSQKGITIYVEIKAGKDTLRPSQIEFKKRILDQGANHFTTRSVEALQNAMEIFKL